MMSQGASRLLLSSRMVLRSNFPRRPLHSKPFFVAESLALKAPTADGYNLSPHHTINRNAPAKPCFAWEEKRQLGVSTPEELEKRIDVIKVGRS